MKLTKQQVIKFAAISAADADVRLMEFNKYHTFEPNPSLQDRQKVWALWPQAQYFDIGSIEGWTGEFEDGLLIIVRGTDSITDWARDFMFGKKVIPYNGTNPKILVHDGFLRSYKLIRSYIQKIVSESKSEKVYFFGHSLGAAVIALAALDIQYNFPQKQIGAIAIGMPNIGNLEFKKSFEKRLPDFTRIENGSDLIPLLPPLSWGWSQIGHFIHVGSPRKKWPSKPDHNWNLYLESMKTDLKDDDMFS